MDQEQLLDTPECDTKLLDSTKLNKVGGKTPQEILWNLTQN